MKISWNIWLWDKHFEFSTKSFVPVHLWNENLKEKEKNHSKQFWFFISAHLYKYGFSRHIMTSNSVPLRASHSALHCATRTKVNMCFAHGKKNKEKKERKQEKNIHDTNDDYLLFLLLFYVYFSPAFLFLSPFFSLFSCFLSFLSIFLHVFFFHFILSLFQRWAGTNDFVENSKCLSH